MTVSNAEMPRVSQMERSNGATRLVARPRDLDCTVPPVLEIDRDLPAGVFETIFN